MSKEFKKIRGFPRYMISTEGDVINDSGKKLKQEKTKNGYLRVSLSNGSIKHKHLLVHRLVAESFIPNPKHMKQVDHINENKADNRVNNLRWSTPLDNLIHSDVINKASTAKFTEVRCKTTGKIYGSIKEASETLGLHHSNIVACCNGRRNKCGGLEWEYINRKEFL